MQLQDLKLKKKELYKQIINLFIVFAIAFTCFPKTVCASSASITFDKEEYIVNSNENFFVDVQISADGKIGLYNAQLQYDTSCMEYIGGGEQEENGVITLKGTGFENGIDYRLEFKAISDGKSSIYVRNAEIALAGEETTERYTIEKKGKSSVIIGNTGKNESIPTLGTVSIKDNQLLYVVDMKNYELDSDIWDYQKTTMDYAGAGITLLTDNQKRILVIALVDDNQNFSYYAVKDGVTEFYPISDRFISGSEYFIVSAEACSDIPDEISKRKKQDNEIFYAVDESGNGEFCKYSPNKGIVSWDTSEESYPKNNSVYSLSIILGCLLLVILVILIILYRKKTGLLFDVKQHLFVIGELTGREIKRKYARSFFGIAWSVLNPLLYMIVMSVIFSSIF